MVVDYWIIRRGNLHVPSLYIVAEGAPYTYYHGWNFRAVAAWVAGVAFTVHGLADSLHPGSVSSASSNMYKLGFLLSFFMGCAVYYVLCLVWPPPVYPSSTSPDAQGSMKFEFMAPSEGFFPDETVDSIRGVLSGTPECDSYITPATFDGKSETREVAKETYSV